MEGDIVLRTGGCVEGQGSVGVWEEEECAVVVVRKHAGAKPNCVGGGIRAGATEDVVKHVTEITAHDDRDEQPERRLHLIGLYEAVWGQLRGSGVEDVPRDCTDMILAIESAPAQVSSAQH